MTSGSAPPTEKRDPEAVFRRTSAAPSPAGNDETPGRSRPTLRARRWLRALALGGAVLVVGLLVVGTVVLVRVRGVLSGRSEELVAAVGRAVGLPIAVDRAEVSWWPPGATAHDIEIPDRSPYGPGDLARIDEARIQVALMPLMRGEIVVTEVRLVAPVLFVVRGVDGGWNLGATPAREAPARSGDASSAGATPAIVIDSVRVRNARLVYRDRAIPGLGELEIKSGDALLRRRGDVYRATFNAQTLGGDEDNVEGSMVVPSGDAPGEVTLHLHATGLGGARLPEVAALLRGAMPFGIALDGQVDVTLDATLPRTWPPRSATGRTVLDAGAAGLRAAGGWVAKPAGRPLNADLELRAGTFGLAVDRASLASGDLRVVASPAEPRDAAPDAGQGPLLLSLDGIDAERLAAWVPALANLHPRGALFLEGRVTPTGDGVATDLRAATSQLALDQSGRAVTVASASVDLSIAPGTKGVLGALRMAELKSAEGSIATLSASVGGGMAQPLDVAVNGAQLERNGVVLDSAGVDLVVRDGDTEIRSVRLGGLGGSMTARGRVLRDRDGVYAAALQPEWSGVDLSRLLALVGGTEGAQGIFSGHASLETSAPSMDAALDNLNGTFAAQLGDGVLPGVNVARLTLANLDGVPKLEEAALGRARERLPELLAPTSTIGLLRVGGTVNEGRVQIAELRLDAGIYALEAHGRLAFDGETDLEGTLSLTEDASRKLLSGSGGGVLQALAGSDEQVRIPIALRGRYPDLRSAPSSEFLADAAARAIRLPGNERAVGFLRRLLGGGED